MDKLFKGLHKGKDGFTLIELLVVVAILGVLAGVVIPNIIKFIERGEEEAMATEMHNVQVAVTAYVVVNPAELPTSSGGAGEINSEIDDYLIGDIAGVGYPTYYVSSSGAVYRVT